MVLCDRYERPENREIGDFLRIFQRSRAMLNSHNYSFVLKKHDQAESGSDIN